MSKPESKSTVSSPAKSTKASTVVPVAIPTIDSHTGYVDFYGYVDGLAGWIFVGWIRRPDTPSRNEHVSMLAQFDRGSVGGKVTVAYIKRADLVGQGIGVVMFVQGTGRIAGNLVDLRVQIGDEDLPAITGHLTKRFQDRELLGVIRPILVENAVADTNRMLFLRLISRPIYDGDDTLSSLVDPVFFEIDEAIMCPPDGLLLMGWRLGTAHSGYTIRVRSGQLTTEFVPERGVRKPRPDVLDAVGRERGYVDLDCGFLIYLPHCYSAGETTYLEVETATGAIAFANMRISPRRGMDAIKRILETIDVSYEAVDPCFDAVIGPAIAALNRDRLRVSATCVEVAYGSRIAAPVHSIIVPLFGRIDFLEYQMAQFSRLDGVGECEIIYVLDDPRMRRELEVLAHSVFERFQIPFRILLLSRNLGFAPANNVGLRAAHGKYVCFLNSDAFPKSVDWLTQLTDRMEQHEEIGMIGPRLLYEDGSVQHEGCVYQPIPELGGWSFIIHENKGLRPSSGGVRYCPAITGACMVMKRELVVELGGFDETFITGDFEDSDLCMKVRKRGLECAVDLDAELYHLERKSQAWPDQTWRRNLTLYNAWVHQRRWIAAPVAN